MKQPEKRKALGRGLEALLPRKQHSAPSTQHSDAPERSGTQQLVVEQHDAEKQQQNQGPSTPPPGVAAPSTQPRDSAASLRISPGGSDAAKTAQARDDKRKGDLDGVAHEASAIAATTVAAGAVAATAVTAAVATIDSGELRELLLEEIERNPFQTRRTIREDAIEELAASIRANGVMQPIVVRVAKDGKFQLIAGERRWLASKRAGKSRIPALVKQVSDQQALEMTIIENIQREDLGPLEQARAFERLSREFGMTQEMMATRTGKDRATVANYLRLLKLPFDVQMELENNFKITMSHAKLLLMLDTAEQISKAAKEIVSKNLSVIQTEDLIYDMRNPIEKQPKAARVVDPNVREAERELERALGCRVRIKDRKGRGKIVIEYANLTDFDRVIEKLS